MSIAELAGGSILRDETFHVTEAEDKILKAALEVVNEETISGTRMHLIAEKAGMVQSNVHYYYRTKQELLDGLQERVLGECYNIRSAGRKKSKDTLEEQLHIFFQQKKYMITKKKNYDFAELNFIVQSKINSKIRERFQQSYSEWREEIREIITRFCPDLGAQDLEIIPYLAVSLLEGASIQVLVDGKAFHAEQYFAAAEAMVLCQIRNAMKKNEEM